MPNESTINQVVEREERVVVDDPAIFWSSHFLL
jgi:hypothetical protein